MRKKYVIYHTWSHLGRQEKFLVLYKKKSLLFMVAYVTMALHSQSHTHEFVFVYIGLVFNSLTFYTTIFCILQEKIVLQVTIQLHTAG